MRLVILVIVFILQSLINEVDGEVNNIVKSKILFSNQDLNERNVEIIRGTEKTVMSREEIFNFLKQLLSNGEVPKLKSLLDQMGKRELQHIDFLINLTSYYKTATHSLLQSIVDILEEDETNYKNLMRNFELSFS